MQHEADPIILGREFLFAQSYIVLNRKNVSDLIYQQKSCDFTVISVIWRQICINEEEVAAFLPYKRPILFAIC